MAKRLMLAAAASSERLFPEGGRGRGSLQKDTAVSLLASGRPTEGPEELTESDAGSGSSNLGGRQEVRSGGEHGAKRGVQTEEELKFL